MAFQVNTNVNALNAHAQSTFTQTSLSSSLQKLSSGLRINSAKDDASGMAIADSLRSQANTLGQAIRNTNDGMGIIQIADKAMDEQVKILIGLNCEIIIAFDKDIDIDHIRHCCEKFYGIRKVSYIWDKYHLLGEKDSPADAQNKIFEFLMQYRITYDYEEHKKYLNSLKKVGA